MYWNENVVQKLEWNGEISHLEEKQKIAEKIAKIAKDGDVVPSFIHRVRRMW